MSSKFAIENENVLQLLGDFVPQTPTGASPLDPAGPRLPRVANFLEMKFGTPRSRRRRRRGGWGMGRGYPPPQPTKGSGRAS